MSRKLRNSAPLPKAPFAAGVAIMGGMFYAVLSDAKGRQRDTMAPDPGGGDALSVDADTGSPTPSTATATTLPTTAVSFLGGQGQVFCNPAHQQRTAYSAPRVRTHVLCTVRSWRPTCRRMCSLRPTWTTSKSYRCACAAHVQSTCTACAPHVHRMCTACAPHVHRTSTACAWLPDCADPPSVLGARLSARPNPRAVQVCE